MDKLASQGLASDKAPIGISPADEPFPKHRAGLKPYRLPYYVVGLVALVVMFPALRHRASSMVGTKAGQIEAPSGEVPATTIAAPAAAPPVLKSRGEPATAAMQTVPVVPGGSESLVQVRPQGGLDDPQFVVGDRLKLTFYEQIESEEDKWAAGKAKEQRRGASLHMRMEFSGEFQVLHNGAVSVPMLGNFEAAGKSTQQLHAVLSKAFEAVSDRPGNVSIAIVERPPVYIVGPFKAPGAFKHVPGMTVLHVVALAGGLSRDEQMNWQLVDSARETDKHETTIERTKRLLARHALLVSERDGKAPTVPPKLAELATEREVQSLIASESNVRRLAVTTFQSKQKALKSAMDLAASDIETLSQRLEPIDSSLKMRGERVRNFDRLNDKGLSNSNARLQAQSELLELESRRQDVVASIAQAKQKLAIAQQDLESSTLAHMSDLEKEIATIEFDLPLALRALKASEGILGVMRTRTTGAGSSEGSLLYQVLKQTPSGPRFVKADLTTPVELGDVIHVKSSTQVGQ